MTDHKVSDFVTKKSYHTVTLVSKYLIKSTSDTVWIHFFCSSNSLLLSTDVLKYEPCVYPPALFENTGTMLQSENQIPYRDEYTFKYPNPPGCHLHVHLWWRCSDPQNFMKNWADLVMSHFVESILSMQKMKYDQQTLCLMATQVILPQKAIFIWDGRNHQAATLLIRKRQSRYTA